MGIRLFSYFEMIKGAASFASKQAANVDCPRSGVKSTVYYISLLCDPVKTRFHFLRTTSPEEGRSETKRQTAYLHFAFNFCYKEEYRQTK